MYLEELYDYKNLLMKQLCSDPEIVRRVAQNPDAEVPNRELPYTRIFPYELRVSSRSE